jgi:ATP/maltotriose-dependent transcriptional regulator MalT
VIELARTLPTSQQLTPLCVSHADQVMSCELTGEAALALKHGRAAVDCAERTGNQTSRIWAYFLLGRANVLNREWHDALEILETASTIAMEHRLVLVESGVLATIAAAHLGLGDREEALAVGQQAIEVSRRRGTRLWEFPALLTRMRALREIHGVRVASDIQAAIAEADAWLEMSGAKSYEPFLHVERAELARLRGDAATCRREFCEAHRLFTEMGAPTRAEQIAKDLGP